MKKRVLVSLCVGMLGLIGCGEDDSVKHLESQSTHPTPQASSKVGEKTLFLKKEAAQVPPQTEVKQRDLTPSDESVKVEPKIELPKAPQTVLKEVKHITAQVPEHTKPIKMQADVLSQKKAHHDSVAASSAEIDLARATSALEIKGVLEGLETLDVEDNESLHGDPLQVATHKAQRDETQEEMVYRLEAAKAASSARIAAAVKSVENARLASHTSAPSTSTSDARAPRQAREPRNYTRIKRDARVRVTRARADVAILKSKQMAQAAKVTATVEMNRRVYGLDSKEYSSAKSQAEKRLFELKSDVDVAEAKSLGEIAEAVASVEIAKIEEGVMDDDAKTGQGIYLKYLKKPCGFNGAVLAAKHAQSTWKIIAESHSFELEISRLCPNLKSFNKAWIKPLYTFAHTYAKDSGLVPACSQSKARDSYLR